MTENKKPLFDEVEFNTLIPIYTGMERCGQMEDVLYAQSYNLKRNKIKDFISSSIRKAQREAIREIVNHLHTAYLNFARKEFLDEFDLILAKYQGGK